MSDNKPGRSPKLRVAAGLTVAAVLGGLSALLLYFTAEMLEAAGPRLRTEMIVER
jgi:hypothetical protein